jgi:hypothetical protein
LFNEQQKREARTPKVRALRFCSGGFVDPEILLARIKAPQMNYAAAVKSVRSVPGIYAFFGGVFDDAAFSTLPVPGASTRDRDSDWTS